MIFLIDDKKKRQGEFGWTIEKFNRYKGIIQQIYSLEGLKSRSNDIFQKGNIVLYHESFLDNTSIKKEALIIRSQLEEYAKENLDFYLAVFSGSKSSRSLFYNIAHLPVSIVFQNLGVLSLKALDGDINLRYLLFGEKPDIEEELSLKLEIANKGIDIEPAKIAETKNLFLRPTKGNIQNAIEKADVEILYNDVSDAKLSEKVKDWLTVKEYDNIFIPLCFGPVLSDFNGLRLAIHIRCTDTPNQLKNIFIYSYAGIEYLFDNDYFNILKTKNVFLVDYKKRAFEEAIQRDLEPLIIDDLPKELKKIKLEAPKDYDDSHSISNEWAIYRWASAINASDSDIEQIINKVNSQLYFKYLSSIYPKEEIIKVPEERLKIEYYGNPKTLFIDDEADKGWYEIFCKVLYDINGLDFEYLDEEFNAKTQSEIIKLSIEKILKKGIDLVILDLRLHPNDFITSNIHETTGLKILKEIKKINPGIQVIIFSATNKIWNLQVLLEERADGFIVKESPQLSSNPEIAQSGIEKMISSITVALRMSFLKKVYSVMSDIKSFIVVAANDEESEFNIRLKNNLDIAFKLLLDTKYSAKYFNYSFLQLFQIIEDFSNLSYVFRKGTDCYVYVNDKEVCINKTLSDKWQTAISFTDKYRLIQKELPINEKRKRLDTNYLVSGILIFRLGYENSSALNWTKIYQIRNTKAAHFNIDAVLNEEAIFTILNFIKNFINPKKQKETNVEKGLKVKTFVESLDLLKSHFKI